VGDATPAYTGALAAATDGFDVVAPRGADPAEDEDDLATLLSAVRGR
jgi:5-methyltetrahydrofolate--homocysteine methyltransferase